jgi:hypothetical protein
MALRLGALAVLCTQPSDARQCFDYLATSDFKVPYDQPEARSAMQYRRPGVGHLEAGVAAAAAGMDLHPEICTSDVLVVLVSHVPHAARRLLER